MNRRNHAFTARQRPTKASRSRWALPLAFASALLAGTASAGIAIPDNPLTTSSRVAPNILFILDDSGSMNFVAMPRSVKDDDDSQNYGNVEDGLDNDPRDRSYLNNNVYYDPSVTYQPWMQADGTRMTGGQSVTAVYQDWNLASGSTRNLVDNDESIFYVPKTGVTSSVDPNDFDRYQVRSFNGNIRVVRGSGASSTLASDTWNDRDINAGNWWRGTLTVPSGATQLVVTAQNGSGGNPDLYLRFNQAPNTGGYDFRDTSSGNQVITVDNPQAGVWHIGVYNAGLTRRNNRNIRAQALSVDLSEATPTGRTQAEELQNIATWYSYSRSRMKAAKAGASEAFNTLGNDVRVGFRTIWGRNTFNIPVLDGNDGRFEDSVANSTTSRTTWYSRLQAATGSGGTPLRNALQSAGEYFSESGSSGPYGPQSTDQLACRQNFSILTTDGFWNGSYGNAVGNNDNTDGSTITGPNGRSYTYDAASPYSDSWSNTLADVAMRYWKSDLRSTLSNVVPTSSANPAFWQHMVTFGISIGLSGNTGWGSVAEVPANASWPNPTDGENADRIDDLLHAAVNGRGTFVAANNPTAFTNGLNAALAAIVERTSSFSNVATNSVSLDTDTQVFSASYISGTWTGQVSASPVTGSGLGTAAWTSSIPSYPGRASQIFTSRTVSGTRSGTSFPTDAQVTALDRSSASPVNFPVTGELNAAYIAGSRALERNNGGNLRNRNGVLGDIVNSSPAYVKDTNTLYVGANDGMMHAFDAESGEELFAYVPSGINWANLSTISRPDYAHKFFVDGPISVSSRSLTPDENILVGTLGRGGKGLYSLNVDDPEGFSASDFNWELKETPGNNMGLVLGKPLLTTAKNGTKVAIIGNGINSTSERAVLVVVDLDTGDVIREIDTGAGSAAMPNGLSAPAGVFGADGKSLAYVYAGDMLGNVWKFDLTSTTPGSWTAKKLFTATDDEGVVQPISAGVTVATHPRTFERWVFFGTGRFLTTADANGSNDIQSMYGFVDRGSPPILDRGDLTERQVTVAGNSGGYPVRGFESHEDLPSDSKGWYIDLVEAGGGEAVGERIVQNAQVVATVLVTASIIPSGDACESGGRGYINALDAFTGTSTSVSYFDLDGDGQTGDELVGSGGSQVPVGSVNLGIGMPTLPSLLRGMLVVCGSTGDCGDPPTSPPRWGRVSWHEIKKE